MRRRLGFSTMAVFAACGTLPGNAVARSVSSDLSQKRTVIRARSNTHYGLLGAYHNILPEENQRKFLDAMGFKTDDEYFRYVNERLKELGLHWLRLDIFLSPQGIRSTEITDAMAKAMTEAECNIFATFLTRIGGPGDPMSSGDALDNMARQAKAAVERYNGDWIDDFDPNVVIKHWQIGNEPNNPRARNADGSWKQGAGPKDYVRVYQKLYSAIKEADPSAMVALAGVWGQLGEGRSPFEDYYDQVLGDLAGKDVDIFDWHWFGNAYENYRDFEKVYATTRRMLSRNGFPQDLPIWMTEVGTSTGKSFATDRLQSEEDQAASLIRRFVFPLTLGVKKVFWAWALIEGFRFNDTYFDHTGLIYDGALSDDKGAGVKKLAFHTYSRLTRVMYGAQFSKEIPNLGEKIYCYEFKRQRGNLVVLWNDDFSDKPAEKDIVVSLAGAIFPKVKVTDAVSGQEQNVTVSHGKVHLKLGPNPLFVELL